MCECFPVIQTRLMLNVRLSVHSLSEPLYPAAGESAVGGLKATSFSLS